jgi:hypothetical protein
MELFIRGITLLLEILVLVLIVKRLHASGTTLRDAFWHGLTSPFIAGNGLSPLRRFFAITAMLMVLLACFAIIMLSFLLLTHL